MTTYALDNAWQHARQRLTALECWLDADTIRHLSARGVDHGWHCLEVGAGGGSIAAWLGDRVGSNGYVLATDLNPRHVVALTHPHVRAVRHDITSDPLSADSFDLAHTRLVLMHLPERGTALDRLTAALKPGGWLVVEEMDFASTALDPASGAAALALFAKALAAHHEVVSRHGMDPFYGRRLLGELRSRGLMALGSEGHSSCAVGGSPAATAWCLTIEQLREEIVDMEAMTDAEVTAIIALLSDPATTFLTQTTVAAWGQKPAA